MHEIEPVGICHGRITRLPLPEDISAVNVSEGGKDIVFNNSIATGKISKLVCK